MTRFSYRPARPAGLTLPVAGTVAMATAALVTLPTIGRQPLSWDEAVTLGAAERSPGELWAMLRHTDAPLGLYYLLMHLWVGLGDLAGAGHSATWLRLPSALAAIAATGLLVVLVARWFDPSTALVSGVLLAVHPLLSFYAQDARPYTLVTLAFLAATWALARALEGPTAQRLSLYVLLVVAAIYLHLFVVYALPAHAFLILRTGRYPRRWAVAAGAIGLAVAPLVLVARHESAEIAWIGRPTPGGVVAVLTHVLGGGWLVLVLLVIAISAARSGRLRPAPYVGFLLVWLIAPLLGLVLADFLVPDLVARYGLVCVPALVALVAVAATRQQQWAGRALVAVVAAVALGATVVQQARPYKYEDYRSAADIMGDLARPGDAVMFFPMSMRAGFEAYQHLEPDLRNVRDAALAPGGAPVNTDQIGGVDAPVASIPGRFASAPRIFVLGDSLATVRRLTPSALDRAELASLSTYRVVRVLRWGVVWVTVLDRTCQLSVPTCRPSI